MLDKNLLDVMCPDCHNRMRINIDKSPGHCYYCGRLLKYNKDTRRIEPGPGEATDLIETQYEFLRRRQQFGEDNK